MRRSRETTMAWQGLLWLASIAAFVALTWVCVLTVRGQMLDTVALYGNTLGRRTVAGPLDGALGAISVATTVLVLIIVAAVAVVRRRVALALTAAVIVVGSAATTYLLKQGIDRPWLGVDPDRAYAGNSLPSGHTTAAAAFSIGLTLVLPPRVRGVAGLLGATYTAVVGVATLSSGWHRPSDVVAAYLVVAGWAALGGLVLVLAQGPQAVVTRRERAEWSVAAALAVGSLAVVAGIALLLYVAQRMSQPVEEMSSSLLRLGYLGSVLAVAGASYLMVAVILVSVHRVVPHHAGTAAAQRTAGAGAGG